MAHEANCWTEGYGRDCFGLILCLKDACTVCCLIKLLMQKKEISSEMHKIKNLFDPLSMMCYSEGSFRDKPTLHISCFMF